jgi:hypothetical protein
VSIAACQHIGFIFTNYKVMKQISKCLIGEETSAGGASVELVQSAFICSVATELIFGRDVASFGSGLMCNDSLRLYDCCLSLEQYSSKMVVAPKTSLDSTIAPSQLFPAYSLPRLLDPCKQEFIGCSPSRVWMLMVDAPQIFQGNGALTFQHIHTFQSAVRNVDPRIILVQCDSLVITVNGITCIVVPIFDCILEGYQRGSL